MEKYGKLSQGYQQIPSLSVSLSRAGTVQRGNGFSPSNSTVDQADTAADWLGRHHLCMYDNWLAPSTAQVGKTHDYSLNTILQKHVLHMSLHFTNEYYFCGFYCCVISGESQTEQSPKGLTLSLCQEWFAWVYTSIKSMKIINHSL